MEKNIIDSPSWVVVIHALIQLETLERLCALGQSALEMELKELQDAMDEDYKSLTSENEEGDYLAHINDEYIQVAETLPYLYWYSQLLIAHSFFERSLDAICMSHQKEKQYSLSLKDISGQGITRAKTYLVKVCSINTPFHSTEWQWATLFAEIRNAIAHRNGYVDYSPDDKRSLYYRFSEKGIEVKTDVADQQDGRIILTRDLVLASINTYRTIIKDIGGLDRDFVTPKHGLPSNRTQK
jgi:hypothetical protein